MLDRAYRLSSCWSHFTDECNWLKTAFSRLKYPKHLVNSTIKSFVDSKVCDQQRPLSQAKETDDTVRVVLPFIDQISADIVKEQLKDLNLKVNTTIHPVSASRKIEQELNAKEAKPSIVNEQCVVYNFQCDRCDAGYVGYTWLPGVRNAFHKNLKAKSQRAIGLPFGRKYFHNLRTLLC